MVTIMLKQLSVLVENKVGGLLKVTHVLYENNINIKAIASFDSPEFTIMRMVVDDEEKAKDTLTKAGFMVTVSEVLAVEMKNKPGSLNTVLDIIANNGLCVDYVYSFVYREDMPPLMVIHVNDMVKAHDLLTENNITLTE